MMTIRIQLQRHANRRRVRSKARRNWRTTPTTLPCRASCRRSGHPQVIKWPNRDPLGEAGFELLRGKRASLLGDGPNLYTFVENNPLNSWDVNGLHLTSVPGEIAGGIAGEIMDKLRALAKTAGGIAVCSCAGCLAALNIRVYSCAWYLDGDDWVRCTCDLLKESWGTKALCRTCTFGASNAVDLVREYIGCDDLGDE
jgi:hypothetical protein